MKRKTKPTPEQALDFLENIRHMQQGQDRPTKLISLRVPGSILNSFKQRAEADGRAYQTMMIQALREFLLKRCN